MNKKSLRIRLTLLTLLACVGWTAAAPPLHGCHKNVTGSLGHAAAHPFGARDASTAVSALGLALRTMGSAWENKPGPTCPVLLGVSEGLRATAQVLATVDEHPTTITLPDVSVDISACGAWAPPTGVVLPEEGQAAVDSAALVLTLGEAALERIEQTHTRCTAKQVLFGASNYLITALPEVLDELGHPDGVFVLDGGVINLTPCEVIEPVR